MNNSFRLALIFLWLGVFITISFIETPLKFQVDGMTLPVALGLGKLMFSISTNIQLGISVVALFLLFSSGKKLNLYEVLLFNSLLLILLIQKSWLLPALSFRADMVIMGKPNPASGLHNIFIVSEIIKLFLLLIWMLCLIKIQKTLKLSEIKSKQII